MKIVKKLAGNFSYSGKMLRLMWCNDKAYLFYVLLELAIVLVNTAVTRYRNKYRRAIDVDLNPIARRTSYFINIGSSFSFIKEIKTYRMEKELLNRYSDLQGELYKGADKTIRLSLTGYIIARVMDFLLGYAYLGFRVLVRGDLSIANFPCFLRRFIISIPA